MQLIAAPPRLDRAACVSNPKNSQPDPPALSHSVCKQIERSSIHRCRISDMALKKQALPLESDPEIFTSLIHGLGVSRSLSFIDVYSLDDLGNFSIPRPVLGLILVYPTAADYEDEIHQYQRAARGSSGDDIDCIWFKQTIHNACGFYAILHTLTNGIARSLIGKPTSKSDLENQFEHSLVPRT